MSFFQPYFFLTNYSEFIDSLSLSVAAVLHFADFGIRACDKGTLI